MISTHNYLTLNNLFLFCLCFFLCHFSFFRFCVGDKFFLKNNMILCQTDYEEGLMKEGYAPQVRWPRHSTRLWGESCERTWKGTCSQTPKALPSSPALILDNVHKKRPLWGTAVQNSHRDLLWVGKGVLQVPLSKVTLVLDIAVALLKQPPSFPLPLRSMASWRQSTPRPDNSHFYIHETAKKKNATIFLDPSPLTPTSLSG